MKASTTISIRLNNGEISEGVEALRAFCAAVLNQDNDRNFLEFIDGMAILNNENPETWRKHWEGFKKVSI